jgi:ankyrin repeat protein
MNSSSSSQPGYRFYALLKSGADKKAIALIKKGEITGEEEITMLTTLALSGVLFRITAKPLLWACRYEQWSVVKMLLNSQESLDVNIHEEIESSNSNSESGSGSSSFIYDSFSMQYWSPLMWSIRHGDVETVEHLLERGASLHEPTDALSFECFCAHQDQKKERRSDVLESLLKAYSERGYKMNISQKDKDGLSALHYAASCKSVLYLKTIVTEYLKFGVIKKTNKTTFSARDSYGMTPLMYAAKEMRLENIVFLIEKCGKDVDIDARDNKGYTALTYATVGRRNMKGKNKSLRDAILKVLAYNGSNLETCVGRGTGCQTPTISFFNEYSGPKQASLVKDIRHLSTCWGKWSRRRLFVFMLKTMNFLDFYDDRCEFRSQKREKGKDEEVECSTPFSQVLGNFHLHRYIASFL